MYTLEKLQMWLIDQELNEEEAHAYWVLMNCFFEGKITFEYYTEKCAEIFTNAKLRKEGIK
jgi:hypothetical protein